jgi:cytochrome c5
MPAPPTDRSIVQGQRTPAMSEHEPFIKTPRQLITVVTLAFIVPVLLIVLLATFVSSGARTGAGSDGMTPEAIESRIRPVAGFQLAAADGPKALRPAEEVYKAQCAACHDAGAAGAPKLADVAAWAPRLKTGYEVLLTSVLKGKGAMAAQGGGEYSDLEIGRAVVYMANKSGGSLEEPKAPAEGAAK